MYPSVGQKDYAGLWTSPQTPNPYTLPMWADYLTIVCATFAGLYMLASPGNWLAMKFAPRTPFSISDKIGVCNPIDKRYMYGATDNSGIKVHWLTKLSLIAYAPAGNRHWLTRFFIFLFINGGVYYGITFLILYGMCEANEANIWGNYNGVGGHNPYCYIKPTVYIWTKTTWATVFFALFYPINYISGLCEANLPDYALQGWYSKKQEQDKKRSNKQNIV